MLQPVLAWLDEQGVVAKRTELATHGRSRADVIAITEAGVVVAIELKVRDWRRALHQALLNRYVADESYVAMWWTAATRECESECARFGIGLLSIEERAVQVIVPPRAGEPHELLASSVRRRLSEDHA